MTNEKFNLSAFPEIFVFRDAVVKFCLLLETDIVDSVLWTRQILDVLAEIYAIGNKLPDLTLFEISNDASEKFYIGEPDWKQIFEHVSRALPQRYYWMYFDPIAKTESVQEAVMGDLADDLADIYRDLKSGLNVWENQKENQIIEIAWNWKFLFQAHWGQHAVDAKLALHQLVHS